MLQPEIHRIQYEKSSLLHQVHIQAGPDLIKDRESQATYRVRYFFNNPFSINRQEIIHSSTHIKLKSS